MVYKKRSNFFVTVFFAIALLFFLLPFVKIEVAGELRWTITGIEILSGKLDQTQQIKSKHGFLMSVSTSETIDKNIYVASSVFFGLIGCIVSLFNFRAKSIITGVLGILAATCLIILYVQISNQSDNTLASLLKVVFVVKFTLWYFLSLISFLAAAFFSYRQGNVVAAHDPVPANAPQMPIKNPGEQSEFPTSPSESEVG